MQFFYFRKENLLNMKIATLKLLQHIKFVSRKKSSRRNPSLEASITRKIYAVIN